MRFLLPFFSFLAFLSCCLASEARKSATSTSLRTSSSVTKSWHRKSGESSATSRWPSISPPHRTRSYHSLRSSRTHTHISHPQSSHTHSSHKHSSHLHTSATISPTSSKSSTRSTSSTTSTSISTSISTSTSTSTSTSPSSTSISSSLSSLSSSTSSSTSKHHDGGGGDGTTTYTVSHHHTVVVALGAYVFGGDDGGFAAVKDISGVAAIAAGELALITTDSDGDLEESTISEISAPTRTKSSTVSSTTSATSSTSSSSSSSSSTSSSATGSPSPFVIAPKTGASKQAQNDFTEKLKQLAALDTTRTVIGLNNNIALWFANLTPDDADTIEADPIVQEFFPSESYENDYEPPVDAPSESMYRRDVSNGPSITKGKRNNKFKQQEDADRSLKVISQPSHITPAEAHGYDYLVEAGRGVTIFVLDGGAIISHKEFTDGGDDKGTREVIFVTPGDAPGDHTGHGTCVASKAVGFRVGTAKSANLIVVQIKEVYRLVDPNGPPDGKKDWRFTTADIFAGLVLIKDRVVSDGLQGKAVVNMSQGVRMERNLLRSKRGQSLIRQYKKLLQDLADLEVVLVTASGNSKDRRESIDEYPALLGLGDNGVPLIIVGAVTWECLRTPYSQGATEITVSAPGDILCADYQTDDLTEGRGTSYAAPAVAGVAAVLLSTQDPEFKVPPPIAINMRDKIQSLAYPRNYYTNPPPPSLWIPPVVYNGVDNYDAGCSSSGGSKRRRSNETQADSCPPPSYPPGTQLTQDIVQFVDGFAWNNCLFDVNPMIGISVTESVSSGVWSYVVLCDCSDADYYVHLVLSNGTEIITPLTQGGPDIVQEQEIDNLGSQLVEWFYTGESN